MKTKIFYIPSQDAFDVIENLVQFLKYEKYTVTKLHKTDGLIINVLKNSTLKTIFGLKEQFTLNIDIEPNSFTLTFTEMSWLDKILIGIISSIIFPPFILFPIIGGCNQFNATKKIIHYLNTQIDIKIRKRNAETIIP